jgi:hypothetical protein
MNPLIEAPVPAAKEIPKWWKEIPKQVLNTGLDFDPPTVKMCAPTIDILTSGYIVKLWSDINITQNNTLKKDNRCKVLFPSGLQHNPTSIWHPDQVSNFEYNIPDNFYKTVIKYHHGWTIKTPKGWSCLITHPFGYNNLPFYSLPALIDTDILNTDINTPFIVKKDFTGIIKRGTPMFQIIPVKRESWSHEVYRTEDGIKQYYIEQQKLLSKFINYYGSLRERKRYR